MKVFFGTNRFELIVQRIKKRLKLASAILILILIFTPYQNCAPQGGGQLVIGSELLCDQHPTAPECLPLPTPGSSATPTPTPGSSATPTPTPVPTPTPTPAPVTHICGPPGFLQPDAQHPWRVDFFNNTDLTGLAKTCWFGPVMVDGLPQGSSTIVFWDQPNSIPIPEFTPPGTWSARVAMGNFPLPGTKYQMTLTSSDGSRFNLRTNLGDYGTLNNGYGVVQAKKTVTTIPPFQVNASIPGNPDTYFHYNLEYQKLNGATSLIIGIIRVQ